MAVSVGDRIGRFEILGALGAGGMGEVYRARDPQLQREVAIKVLPAAFASVADRQRRFEQEARAAGILNHPNIVAVHDVGIHDGVPFIVTELLDGETLRHRMRGRPLSCRVAVDYATQIASGLAAGHERGIVHRDIKPDNLFLTADGRIKILDFGLAKLTGPDLASEVTETLTVDGVQLAPVMGTAVYMSPEQARGLRTDHRTDIFSFGAVLYEMLTGAPPFRRSTPADTISAILNDEPPELASLAPDAGAFDRLVRHCLEKKPENRFQSARDLLFDLETLRDSTVTAARERRRPSRAGAFMAVVGVTAAAGLGYLAGMRATPPAMPTAVHDARRVTDFEGVEQFPAISPDGRSIAFTTSVNGTRQIFVRLLAGGPPLAITKDTADHQFPRWAPDGNSLFYFSPAPAGSDQGAIWTIPALGGPPRRVTASISGADVSAERSLASFQILERKIQLVTMAANWIGCASHPSLGCRLPPLSALVPGRPMDRLSARRRRQIRRVRRICRRR